MAILVQSAIGLSSQIKALQLYTLKPVLDEVIHIPNMNYIFSIVPMLNNYSFFNANFLAPRISSAPMYRHLFSEVAENFSNRLFGPGFQHRSD